MYLKYQQLFGGLIFGAVATVWLYFGWLLPAFILYLFAAYCAFWHFSRGPVFLAWNYQKQGLKASAAKILDSISQPDKLSPRKQAYYWLTKARLADEVNDLTAAEAAYNLAVTNSGLYEMDEAVSYIRLAEIHEIQGLDERADQEYRMAARYPSNASRSDEIESLRKRLESNPEETRKPVSLFDEKN